MHQVFNFQFHLVHFYLTWHIKRRLCFCFSFLTRCFYKKKISFLLCLQNFNSNANVESFHSLTRQLLQSYFTMPFRNFQCGFCFRMFFCLFVFCFISHSLILLYIFFVRFVLLQPFFFCVIPSNFAFFSKESTFCPIFFAAIWPHTYKQKTNETKIWKTWEKPKWLLSPKMGVLGRMLWNCVMILIIHYHYQKFCSLLYICLATHNDKRIENKLTVFFRLVHHSNIKCRSNCRLNHSFLWTYVNFKSGL